MLSEGEISMTVNRSYSVIVHQVTSPRAVQAALVIMFSVTICMMALQQQQIPEVMVAALSAIIGYYFAERSDVPPTLVTKNGTTIEHVSSLVDRTLAEGGSVPRSIPVDAVVNEESSDVIKATAVEVKTDADEENAGG